MKKHLLIFISLIMFSISLVGCGSKESTKYVNGHEVVRIGDREFLIIDTMVDVEEAGFPYNAYVLVDRETSVQYLYLYGVKRAAMEVIVDANGIPILYEGELE